jgi:hypothetical protein
VLQVKFKNQQSREYLWYDLTVIIIECGPLKTIKMVTAARQLSTTNIELENPLDRPLTYKLKSNAECLHFVETMNVGPMSKVSCKVNVEFVSLHVLLFCFAGES